MIETRLRKEHLSLNQATGSGDCHEFWMRIALSLARSAVLAPKCQEVPIGAVVVQYGAETSSSGSLISTGLNLKESHGDPTAHAELRAIRKAAAVLGSWRLSQCTLYVTVEPCLMCASAACHARLDQVVYAASSPKFGALGSLYDLSQDHRLNHRVKRVKGVMSHEAANLMQSFFKNRR